MSLLAVLLVCASLGFTYACLPCGQRVTIRSKLTTRDEIGYRQSVALNPGRAICIVSGGGD